MHLLEAVANVVVALVALLHAWFLALEMFLWEKPIGMRTFRLTPERARATKVLAANQGLYNGFLVAGLLWACGSRPTTTACARSSSAAWWWPACSAR